MSKGFTKHLMVNPIKINWLGFTKDEVSVLKGYQIATAYPVVIKVNF
jgi:hypothetical protein